MLKSCLRACLSLILLFCVKVYSHPHNWIDLKTEFSINSQGQLSELSQYWEFDSDFSQATIADIFHDTNVQPNSLELLGNDMVNNMLSYDYFSELRLDNRLLPLPRPSNWQLDIVERDGLQYLYLHMRFTFASPSEVIGKKLVWQVYDPTYYIDMKHPDISQVIVHSSEEVKCTVKIEEPKPSQVLQDYAKQLDASMQEYDNNFDEVGDEFNYVLDPLQAYRDRLGEEFAETVFIECQ